MRGDAEVSADGKFTQVSDLASKHRASRESVSLAGGTKSGQSARFVSAEQASKRESAR